MELFWQSSYGAVSVDNICEAAGARKGSFYHFFPSKVDLALAVLEEHYSNFKPAMDAAFSPEIPPLERFERLADLIVEIQGETAARFGRVCGCPFVTLGSEMACQEEAIRSKITEIFGRYERYYESAIRDAAAQKLIAQKTDVKRKASEVFSYSLGLAVMARIRNDPDIFLRYLKEGMLELII